MIDLAKEIWQTMCTNKLRTFLTGLSVAWGIFMLILLLAISKGVIDAFEARATNDNPYTLEVYGGRTTMPYRGMKEGRDIELRERSFDDIKRGGNGKITEVTGNIDYTTTLSTTRDYVAGSCQGVYPNDRRGRGLEFIEGRFVNDADISGSRKVIVLCQDAAETLFGSARGAVGKSVSASGLAFTVVGVYTHPWRQSNFIPYTTARALKGYDDSVGSVTVTFTQVNTVDESEAIKDGVRGVMAQKEQFDPADTNAVWINNNFASFKEALTGLNILNITMWVIGILTLVTGIVGVSNIMFVSVRERTHEIGIRRAIGAKPASILRQIVLESVAMTTVFGYFGIVMGTAATEIVKKVFAGSDFMMAPTVDMGIAVRVTVALIVAGAIAGIFPAIRATKVRPVEALRDE